MLFQRTCLIGALTSKPYAFKARSWELRSVETIDLFDSLNSNIRIDTRGSEILRVLPLLNDDVNEEWISDKTRYAYDGLNKKRFVYPMIRHQGSFFFQENWEILTLTIKGLLKYSFVQQLIVETGFYADLEQIITSNNLFNKIPKLIYNSSNYIDSDFQNYYLIDAINNFKHESLLVKGQKSLALLGINLRLENPVLYIQLNKLINLDKLFVGYLGPSYNSTKNFWHFGNNILSVGSFLNGKHTMLQIAKNFLKKNDLNIKLKTFFRNNFTCLFGNEFLKSFNSNKIFYNLTVLTKLRLVFNSLYMYSGQVAMCELGAFSNRKIDFSKKSIYFFLNTEEVTHQIMPSDVVIFQGQYNYKLKQRYNIILPTSLWTEKSNLFINCFGIIQKSKLVNFPSFDVKNDWRLLEVLNIYTFGESPLINNLPKYLNLWLNKLKNYINNYDNGIQMHKFTFLNSSKYIRYNLIIQNLFNNFNLLYYTLSTFEKSSKTMNLCSEKRLLIKNNFLK